MQIQLTVTPQEADLVIGALAKMPFEQVWQLVPRLQKQAQEQVRAVAAQEGAGDAHPLD